MEEMAWRNIDFPLLKKIKTERETKQFVFDIHNRFWDCLVNTVMPPVDKNDFNITFTASVL